MVSDISPAIPRRELRLALRELRGRRGLTQEKAAGELGWSLSKLQHIEIGDAPVSLDDLHALIQLYGVTDGATIAQLVELVHAAWRDGWWDEADFREHLTPPMTQLLKDEREAERISVFQPIHIPGFLQIRPYAEAVLDEFNPELCRRGREVRLAARLRRKEGMLGREDAAFIHIILSESALRFEIGGRMVMGAQLAYLLHIWRKEPSLRIRILPAEAAGGASGVGGFIILAFGPEDHSVVYREQHLSDELIHCPDLIKTYERRFERLWDLAMTEQASRELVRERAKKLSVALELGPMG